MRRLSGGRWTGGRCYCITLSSRAPGLPTWPHPPFRTAIIMIMTMPVISTGIAMVTTIRTATAVRRAIAMRTHMPMAQWRARQPQWRSRLSFRP